MEGILYSSFVSFLILIAVPHGTLSGLHLSEFQCHPLRQLPSKFRGTPENFLLYLTF